MQVDVVYFDGVRYRFQGNYYQRNAKSGERFLHRAIWIKSNGPIEDCYVVHHLDENTRNNDISNLELLLASDHHKLHFGEMWKQRDADPEARKLAVAKASEWHRSEAGRKAVSEVNARNRAAGKYDGKDKSAFYAGRDKWLASDECKEFNRQHINKLREQGKVSNPTDECRAKSAEWHASEEGKAWHSENAKRMWANQVKSPCTCQVCGTVFDTYYPLRTKFCSGRCKATALRRRRASDPGL